ncbi:hypothetical protein SCP_0704290 [Sparassis crispa]|uniref:Uncharacterized protein n=1 Tax=Sparassis crispa TaxID=139825 RepID=A0A401GSN8_9APHY|nr:hypothetical protein SCP_0704290 [Sparassis crispa]GBE85242.1 hypothetical protein SCP_0704290 [Sparassis crispa]
MISTTFVSYSEVRGNRRRETDDGAKDDIAANEDARPDECDWHSEQCEKARNPTPASRFVELEELGSACQSTAAVFQEEMYLEKLAKNATQPNGRA